MIEKLILHILNPKIWVIVKRFEENDVSQRKLQNCKWVKKKIFRIFKILNIFSFFYHRTTYPGNSKAVFSACLYQYLICKMPISMP